MNILIVILALVAVIVAMGGIIYILAKDKKANKKEIDQLKGRLEIANKNLYNMKNYITQILAIKSETQTNIDKIKKAKTDEEVISIINDIIYANNNRVQND